MKRKLEIYMGTCPSDSLIQNMYVINTMAKGSEPFNVKILGHDDLPHGGEYLPDDKEYEGEYHSMARLRRGLVEGSNFIVQETRKDLLQEMIDEFQDEVHDREFIVKLLKKKLEQEKT